MILDQENLFSDSQVVTTSANSANVIDNLGNSIAPSGFTQKLSVFARVVQAFVGATSLQVSLVSSDDAAQSVNVTTHFSTAAIPVASLTAGALIMGTAVPSNKMRKYLGLKYTVVGSFTSGSIIAGLVDDIDSVLKTTDFGSGFSVV